MSFTSFSSMTVPRQVLVGHSRPQMPRSFWSAPRIATSCPVQWHSGFEWLYKFRTNQICQTWLWACAEWREVRESLTSGVGHGQRFSHISRFLVLTKRSAASGDENGGWPASFRLRVVPLALIPSRVHGAKENRGKKTWPRELLGARSARNRKKGVSPGVSRGHTTDYGPLN